MLYFSFLTAEPPPDPPPAAVAQQFKALSSNANATLSLDRIALESRFSRSIGRRVCVSGEKSGILRYFGPLHVADGLFCGVELDEELGQHDGLVDGRRYFKAAHNRGIFAPLEKVALLLSSPSPPKPNMSTNNRDRLDSSNENLQLHIQNNNLRTLNTHGSPDDAIRPLEYITDVEPHLMSNSMLDEEQDVIELPPYEDLLSQSFEQFLRQSKVFSTESSMIRSSGQFSSDVDHSIEEHEQSGSEINNQMKTYLPVSNMHQPSLSRGDDSADKPCMINSSTTAVPSIDKHYKRTDTFNIEELESLNASPQLLVESFQFDRPSSDKDDQENELLTPIFDNAFNMRLNSDDTFDSNNDNIEPAPKRALVSSTPFTTVAQQSNPKDEISLNTSYVKEKTVPDSNVEENMSTHVNQLRERPASTISADTGYQGDTEYEMSNGSNSARNQQYKTAAKNQQFNTNFGRPVALETSQDVDLSKCSVKLVYSDKKGNVRKVVQLEGHSASVLGLSLEVTTNLTSQISVPSELGQDISNENPPVAQSLRDDKKPNVQRQQQQRSPFKNTLSSNGAKTSSKNVIKLPLSAKNSAAANENGEFKKPRVPLVKESEPKPARVKPATKPSKNAEIMAKLQQSIAQERVKPKKEVKSRVFIASEAIKETSPSESAPSETAMKGLRRPPVKNSADAFKFKSTNQTRATLRNSNPVSSSQISAKQIGKVVAKNNANLEKLDADLALARRQISGNAKGFEVLTIVFQHLILNLKTTLRRKSIDLTIANEIAQTLGEEKVSLMMEIASMKEQHENTINAMRNEYKEKLHLFERAMNAEHDKKIFEGGLRFMN
uniref:CAP-Gly domain-containing protein n=1 Tax=Romanomermis culicivorax TaxID=13658 RepID=A0A915KN13_ROMCU